MEMKFYLEEIQELSRHNNGVVLYPYKDSKKVFNRFEQKIFWMGDKNVVINGWLGEIYKFTDGIDFCNFYIVPFNKYFNKKDFDFDDFCRSWIINQNDPNEIMADFYAFMTDGNILVGYLENLKDPNGNNFIGITTMNSVSDVIIISSNIYKLFDVIIHELYNNDYLKLPTDLDFWKERDQILNLSYMDGKISRYKKNFLYQIDSDNYKLSETK